MMMKTSNAILVIALLASKALISAGDASAAGLCDAVGGEGRIAAAYLSGTCTGYAGIHRQFEYRPEVAAFMRAFYARLDEQGVESGTTFISLISKVQGAFDRASSDLPVAGRVRRRVLRIHRQEGFFSDVERIVDIEANAGSVALARMLDNTNFPRRIKILVHFQIDEDGSGDLDTAYERGEVSIMESLTWIAGFSAVREQGFPAGRAIGDMPSLPSQTSLFHPTAPLNFVLTPR